MIKFKVSGKFNKTQKYLEKTKEVFNKGRLNKYGEMGVAALLEATPKKTGKTSQSWTYEIKEKQGKLIINWYNTNIVNGTNVAVVLQYGHMSPRGYWIEGRDYINPAMQPVFDEIAKDMWEEVSRVE